MKLRLDFFRGNTSRESIFSCEENIQKKMEKFRKNTLSTEIYGIKNIKIIDRKAICAPL